MQTLNTASTSTTLLIGDNITTGDIGIGASQTTGAIEIGTFATRSSQLTIGGSASTAPVRIDSGSGGIRNITQGQFRVTASSFNFGNKGSVTQTGTQNTAVTLNTPLGKITTVTLDIPSNNIEKFTVNNSTVSTSSIVFLTIDAYTGTSILCVAVDNIQDGSFDIELENAGGGRFDTPCTIAYMVV